MFSRLARCLEELQVEYPYPPADQNGACQGFAAGAIAELVYGMRRRAGFGHVELARRMSTTQSSIARIDGGGTVPTIEILALLAGATGIPYALALTKLQT